MVRSLKTLRGYSVQGINGEAGQMHDFLFDDRDWTVRHIVVQAEGDSDPRNRLVAPVSYISTDSSFESVYLMLTQEQVKDHLPAETDAPPVCFQHQFDLTGDPDLRSVNEVLAYHVQTDSGAAVGEIVDILLDDDGWQIKSLAVSTPNGLVRVAPAQVLKLSWREKTLSIAPHEAINLPGNASAVPELIAA